jgi:hypothetical protein
LVVTGCYYFFKEWSKICSFLMLNFGRFFNKLRQNNWAIFRSTKLHQNNLAIFGSTKLRQNHWAIYSIKNVRSTLANIAQMAKLYWKNICPIRPDFMIFLNRRNDWLY